jgi:hypothetical protein
MAAGAGIGIGQNGQAVGVAAGVQEVTSCANPR